MSVLVGFDGTGSGSVFFLDFRTWLAVGARVRVTLPSSSFW